MKTVKLALVSVIAASLFACQKEAKTKPVYFTETTYDAVPYDSTTGLPKTLEHETVSSDLLKFAQDNFREKVDIRTFNAQAYNNSSTATDLKVTTQSNVYLTFLNQVTESTNAIAFYTYPTSTPPTSPKEIKTIKYVLPSAGVGSKLNAGDKIKIGNFAPGTSIGLVLMKNAWQPATGALNNNAVHFCYNDALNPEVDPSLKKHVVLVPYTPENKILIGFENSDRSTSTSDHDFNDIILYATINP